MKYRIYLLSLFLLIRLSFVDSYFLLDAFSLPETIILWLSFGSIPPLSLPCLSCQPMRRSSRLVAQAELLEDLVYLLHFWLLLETSQGWHHVFQFFRFPPPSVALGLHVPSAIMFVLKALLDDLRTKEILIIKLGVFLHVDVDFLERNKFLIWPCIIVTIKLIL